MRFSCLIAVPFYYCCSIPDFPFNSLFVVPFFYLSFHLFAFVILVWETIYGCSEPRHLLPRSQTRGPCSNFLSISFQRDGLLLSNPWLIKLSSFKVCDLFIWSNLVIVKHLFTLVFLLNAVLLALLWQIASDWVTLWNNQTLLDWHINVR